MGAGRAAGAESAEGSEEMVGEEGHSHCLWEGLEGRRNGRGRGRTAVGAPQTMLATSSICRLRPRTYDGMAREQGSCYTMYTNITTCKYLFTIPVVLSPEVSVLTEYMRAPKKRPWDLRCVPPWWVQ